jgi:tetratricopeptide (TPR) repeat protein
MGLIAFSFLFLPDQGLCESPLLLKGIGLYKQENYEEAVEMLNQARKEEPKSSAAAFFLGLTYKQLMNYPQAAVHLEDAVTLTPKIKEALLEFVDVLIELGRLDEAGKWLAIAEQEGIFPAKTAFMKGLYYQKLEKEDQAIEAFEKARALDPSLSQAVDFQIAMIYVKQKKVDLAKERLQTVYVRDPLTDLGTFARQYQDILETKEFLERPFRFTVGVFGQYDTNLVLKPIDASLTPTVTGEAVWTLVSSFRVEYVPRLAGPWLFNAQYAFLSNIHSKFGDNYDSMGNSISVTPGYDFGGFSLNVAATYTYVLLRNPDYESYLGYLNAGPLLRKPIGDDKILDVYLGYMNKTYFQGAQLEDENRDSTGLNPQLSFYWFFKNGAFLNFRYEFVKEDTDGANWDYSGNLVALTVSYPLLEKVTLQVYGYVFDQDFKNPNTNSVPGMFGVKREDRTYTGSIGLIWEFYRNMNLLLQYNHTHVDSNIDYYEYKRDLYTFGIEYRF